MHELDSKEFKRQHRWIKVFLTVALVSSALALLQALHLHFDPMAERHYGRLVHVRIGDRDFAIPSEYFRGPIPRGQTNNLHLWVMMPDYTPYRGEISGDRAHIDAGWERHLIVNVEDIEHTNDLASRYLANRDGPNFIFQPQDLEDRYGIHHTQSWYSNARSPEPWIVHDLYFNTAPDGTVSEFISCDRDQPDIVAICSFHDFTMGRLIFTLSYRKSNLPKWKLIHDHVITLFDQFSCVPYSKSISTKNNKGDKICPR
jgi:hypothetical protein